MKNKTKENSESKRYAETSGSAGCCCQGCGKNYTVDLIVDDGLWEAIKPTGKAMGAGLLCGSCIMERIESSHGFDCFNLEPNDEDEPQERRMK